MSSSVFSIVDAQSVTDKKVFEYYEHRQISIDSPRNSNQDTSSFISNKCEFLSFLGQVTNMLTSIK